MSYTADVLNMAQVRFTSELVSSRFWPPAFKEDVARLLLAMASKVTDLALVFSRAAGPMYAEQIVSAVQPVTDLSSLEVLGTREGVIEMTHQCALAWDKMHSIMGQQSKGEVLLNIVANQNPKREMDKLGNDAHRLAYALADLRLPRLHTVPFVPGEKAVSMKEKPSGGKVAIGLGVAVAVGLLLFKSKG